MSWIESHLSLARHPKTLRLCTHLGCQIAEAVGHLHLFWYWCFQYAPDGDITEFQAREIAAAAEWHGESDIVEALTAAGFIDRKGDRVLVHDWRDYTGKVLRRKAKDRVRKRVEFRRSSTGIPQEIRRSSTGIPRLPNLPNLTRPNLPNLPDQPASPPPSPPSPGGSAAWPSPEALVELYNAEAPPECARVGKITPARRAKARKYLADFPDREWWLALLGEVRGSQFLRGMKPKPGHEHFRADFDWLLSKGQNGTENCVKVAEGRYRDHSGHSRVGGKTEKIRSAIARVREEDESHGQ